MNFERADKPPPTSSTSKLEADSGGGCDGPPTPRSLLDIHLPKNPAKTKANRFARSNLGVAFAILGRHAPDVEYESLFQAAVDCFQAFQDVEPDEVQVLNNWGVACMGHGERSTGESRDRLFKQAEEKFQRVEGLAPGTGAYNLACLAALQGDEVRCQELLEKSKLAGKIPAPDYVGTDWELRSVKNCAWFAIYAGG